MATINAGKGNGRADLQDNTGVVTATSTPKAAASLTSPPAVRGSRNVKCEALNASTVDRLAGTSAIKAKPPVGSGSTGAAPSTVLFSSVGANATPTVAVRGVRTGRRPAAGDTSTTSGASTKEEVHVKAVRTVSDSWFNLSRKAGTDKATLMDHYRRLFKLTLMLIEKYDAELDSEMRNRVLERMRFCHLALAPRVPSLLQIFSTIEAVFATADIDRESFRRKISDLTRTADCLTGDPVESFLIPKGSMEGPPSVLSPAPQAPIVSTEQTEQPMDVDVKPSIESVPTETPMETDSQTAPQVTVQSAIPAPEPVLNTVRIEPSSSPESTGKPTTKQRSGSKLNIPVTQATDAISSTKVAIVAPTNRPNTESSERPWVVQAWLENQEQVVPERAPPDDAMPTEEVLEKLNEVYRAAVDADDTLANFCKTIANLSCHRGVQLGWQCFRRTEGPPECTEALVSTFFLKDLINEDSQHCCTRDLMLLWVRMQKHRQMGAPEIGRLASSILDRHSDKSGLFYLMFDVLLEECGFVGYPVMIDLMLRGMGVDLNDIEECEHRGAPEDLVRVEIERNLARQMLKWCVVFEDFPLVMRECAFSSFSLYPTKDALDLIKAVSLRICENRDPSCRCYGHRIEDMPEPRQPGRPQYELLPHDDMFFFEPILDSELPGVHYDTLKDMVTVLHAVRTPVLTLADDLDKYLEEFYSKGRGSKLPTEMRLIAQSYSDVIYGITDTVPGIVAVAAPDGSADSESDSDSSTGSSEFRRRLERQRKELPELGRPAGKKAAGACHKLKTKDKTRPAARRSARQLEREKATVAQQGDSRTKSDQLDDAESLFQDASLEAIESEVEIDSSVISAGTVSSVPSSAVPQIIVNPSDATGSGTAAMAGVQVSLPNAPTNQLAVVLPQQTNVVTPKVVMVSPQQLQRVQLPLANNNSTSRTHKIQVVLNGPKVEVAAAAAAAAAAAQQQVVVPQTTDMTPVAIDTALTALQLPGQLQSTGRQQGAKTKQHQTPTAASIQTASCQQLSVVVSAPSNQSSPQTSLSGSAMAPTTTMSPIDVACPRTTADSPVIGTSPMKASTAKSPHDGSEPSITSQQLQVQAPCSSVTHVIAAGPASNTKPVVVQTPSSNVTTSHCQPTTSKSSPATISAGGASTSAASAGGGQLKTPNFRAVLDRFDRLCGVSLTPPSLADRPVRLEVSGGSGAGAMMMPKLANVQIRNPKKLPAAAPLSPNLSPASSSKVTPTGVKSNFLQQLPADPTRGKISADLLRRLKEEVDNRCSGAPITQFFKYQQKKPVFTNRKEVAVKFSIRKQGPATPTDKEKTSPAADKTILTSPGASQNCNSSSQTRTAAVTPASPIGGTYITQSPATTPVSKVTAKARTQTKTVLNSVSQVTTSVTRCSPVAVRVASPATSSVGATVCVVPSSSSGGPMTSGISAGVSVITTGGGALGTADGGGLTSAGGFGSTPTSLASGSVGAVQVVGCQQVQVERGPQGNTTWTAAGGTFSGAGGVKPEAKVEGGRNTPSVQPGQQQVQVVTAVRGQQQQQNYSQFHRPPSSVAMAPPGPTGVSVVHAIRPQQQQQHLQQQATLQQQPQQIVAGHTATTPRPMLRQATAAQRTSPVLVTTANSNTSCAGPVGHQIVQATPTIVQNQTKVISSSPQQQMGHVTVSTAGGVGVTTVGTPAGGIGVRMANAQVIRQVGGPMGSMAVATIKDAQGGQQNVLMKVISSPHTTAVQGQLASKVQPPARVGNPAVVKAVRATPSPVSSAASVPLSPSSVVTHGHAPGAAAMHIVNNANSSQQSGQQQLQQSTQLQNSTQLQPMQNPVVSVATSLSSSSSPQTQIHPQQIVVSGGVIPQVVRAGASTPEAIKLQVQNAVQQALASQRLATPSPPSGGSQPLHVRVRINGPTTGGSSGQVVTGANASGQVVQLAASQLLNSPQVSSVQVTSNSPQAVQAVVSGSVTTTTPATTPSAGQQQQQTTAVSTGTTQRIITTTPGATGNKIMIPVNSLLQQGAIATSVNGMPVLIIKNPQTGQQQIVHMRQVQHVQTVQSVQQQPVSQAGGAQQGATSVQQPQVQVVTTATGAPTAAGQQQLNRHQLAAPAGTQLAVLRQASGGGLKQQTVVVTQSGQQSPGTTLNRVPIQVTLPVGPTGGSAQIVASSQANSGGTSATPVTVVTTSGAQNQQVQLITGEGSTLSFGQQQQTGTIQTGAQSGATQISSVVVSGANPIVSQSGGLFSAGGQPISVSIASSTSSNSAANSSIITSSCNTQQLQTTTITQGTAGGQQQQAQQHIHQVVQVVGPNSGSAGGAIPSSAIVVNQSGQRLLTVSPDVLQAAVKSGQTKIITYKPALQQPLIGGRAKVVAAEVVGSQQHKQPKKDSHGQTTQPQQQHHQLQQQQQQSGQQQQTAGKAANKLLAKILPHPTGVVQSQQSQQQLQKGGVAVVQQSPSAGVTVVQQAASSTSVVQSSIQQQTSTVIQQAQHVTITGAQQVARMQGGPVQVVKKIMPTVGTPPLNNNNTSTNNNNNKTSAIIVNKASTVAQVLKAPIVTRQASEKERLREITPVLDEDALMEQIMAAEVKEQMAAVKRTMLQCVKADERDDLDNELLLNGNASDKDDKASSPDATSRSEETDASDTAAATKAEKGENHSSDEPPAKKRRPSDDADALRSISDALTFAILSESCAAVAEEDLNAEKTIENEMSVTLPVLSSDSDVDDDKDAESSDTASRSRIGPRPRKVRRRRKSYCSILAESAVLLHESNKRTQTAAQELIASVADKMMEKAFGPLTVPNLGNHQTSGSDVQHGPHAILNGKVVSVQLAAGKLGGSNDENVERRRVHSPAIASLDDGTATNSSKPLVIKQMVMLSPNMSGGIDHQHVQVSSANAGGSPLVASPLTKKKSTASTTTPQSRDDPTGVLHSRYKCRECQRGFFSAYNLRRHLKNVHKIDMGPPITSTSSASPSITTSAAQTPTTPVRTVHQQSHLMAALNGGSLSGPVSNASSVSGNALESDHDDSSLDHFVVVNHSTVASSSTVPPKNSLAALLEAPPVHASPNI